MAYCLLLSTPDCSDARTTASARARAIICAVSSGWAPSESGSVIWDRTEYVDSLIVSVEGGFYSGFDEVAALGQGLLHVEGDGAGGFGDQPGDEAWGLSGAAGAGGSGSGVDVVVVGFGPARFRSQRAGDFRMAWGCI